MSRPRPLPAPWSSCSKDSTFRSGSTRTPPPARRPTEVADDSTDADRVDHRRLPIAVEQPAASAEPDPFLVAVDRRPPLHVLKRHAVVDGLVDGGLDAAHRRVA